MWGRVSSTRPRAARRSDNQVVEGIVVLKGLYASISLDLLIFLKQKTRGAGPASNLRCRLPYPSNPIRFRTLRALKRRAGSNWPISPYSRPVCCQLWEGAHGETRVHQETLRRDV